MHQQYHRVDQPPTVSHFVKGILCLAKNVPKKAAASSLLNFSLSLSPFLPPQNQTCHPAPVGTLWVNIKQISLCTTLTYIVAN